MQASKGRRRENVLHNDIAMCLELSHLYANARSALVHKMRLQQGINAIFTLQRTNGGGNTCICDTSQVPACGSFNWTILLLFDDGMEWIFRSPRKDGAIMSDETNLSLLASEAATLKYIKAKSTIPIPEICVQASSPITSSG